MRKAQVTRTTKETKITISMNLDGSGSANIHTGIGFFDHMLESFARHGFFDLDIQVDGDLHVDSHHTIEDTGIVLGQVFAQALGDKRGIRRYGDCMLPMDEALVLCALDLSGRHYLNYDVTFTTPSVGAMDTEMTREFFYAFADAAAINLHIKQMNGTNNHHIMEAIFKSFAKALDQAVTLDPRIDGVLSTKGSL